MTMTDTTMITASGALVDLAAPDPAAIRIDDIAHHLAQINRYCGAARFPFSVAMHALLVAAIADEITPDRPASAIARLRLYALLHDAHEAYTGDMISPMKRAARGFLVDEVSHRLDRVIFSRFVGPMPDKADREVIAWADHRALLIEKQILLDTDTAFPVRPAWADMVRPMDWTEARDTFLRHFHGAMTDTRMAEGR